MPGRELVAAAGAVVHEPLGQRAVLVARGRMDHHARRLVDDQQPVVLVDDLVGHVFRRERGAGGGGACHSDLFAGAQHVALARRPLRRRSRGLSSIRRWAAARRDLGARREDDVEPPAGLVRRQRETACG